MKGEGARGGARGGNASQVPNAARWHQLVKATCGLEGRVFVELWWSCGGAVVELLWWWWLALGLQERGGAVGGVQCAVCSVHI
jgi:hypothetical protein